MNGREITERKVQGGEMKEEEVVLVESDAREDWLCQPNRGVNPSRQESVQHTDKAINVRLCVARALYLRMRDKTERRNKREFYKSTSMQFIHLAYLPVNQCFRV